MVRRTRLSYDETMRSLALVALSALAAVAACDASSDATNAVDGGVDASADAPVTPFDAGVDAGGGDAGGLSIGITDVSVYAGQKAQLAATLIGADAGAATFAWSLASAPPASVVTTASIALSSTPSPSVVPDLTGDYVLEVTVAAPGAITTSVTMTLHAFAAPVFYARAIFDPSGGQVGLHSVGHDKSDAHAVACAINVQPSEFSAYRLLTLSAAAGAMDAWEAPAGQASRFVFSGTASRTAVDDAGDLATFLIAGTTKSSCLVAPTTLRSINARAGALGQPRFSPDGTRVAFLDPSGASFGVATVAFDGSGYRPIAPVYASPPSGNDESPNIRPEWQDATHLAWPRPLGNGSWQVVVALDAANAAPSPYFTCPGATTPHHVALLADGSVVASYSPSANAPADLFVLKPDANKVCQVVHKLTSLAGAASRAHDFAVSPDQKTVAYLHYDATKNDGGAAPANEGELYAVPVDGSRAATAVGTARVGRIGPRWIGGGSRLAWTRVGQAVDGGDPVFANDVSVVLPDGGGAVDLANGDGLNLIVGAVGPGGSCAVAVVGAPATGAASILAGAAAIALARRKRRRR
jgi:hypothetical protein